MAKEELEVSLLKSDEEFSMSGTLKLSENSDNQRWTRKEKYVWFFTLLFGSAALYATREFSAASLRSLLVANSARYR